MNTIAGATFTYKRYPTSNDYANVARAIYAKYPFMKVPTGKPYVSWSACVNSETHMLTFHKVIQTNLLVMSEYAILCKLRICNLIYILENYGTYNTNYVIGVAKSMLCMYVCSYPALIYIVHASACKSTCGGVLAN